MDDDGLYLIIKRNIWYSRTFFLRLATLTALQLKAILIGATWVRSPEAETFLLLRSKRNGQTEIKVHLWSVWPDLAKFRHFGAKLKSLAILIRFILYLPKFCTYFGKFYWANFQCCEWPNVWEIMQPHWSHWLGSHLQLDNCKSFKISLKNVRAEKRSQQKSEQ